MLTFEKHCRHLSQYELIDLLITMTKKINKDYILDLLVNEKNNIAFYSLDNSEICVNNCPCGLIFNLETIDNKLNVFIMFIATKYSVKGCGYATLFINEFMDYIKNEFYNKYDTINIILDSIMESVTFYEKLGFKWIMTNEYNEKLHILNNDKDEDEDENEDDDIEHFIMIYSLK